MNVVALLEEDEQVLVNIYTHLFVDVEYVMMRHYAGYNKRSVYNRLRKLEMANYIKSEYLPVPTIRGQQRPNVRPKKVYTLTKKGVDTVRDLRGDVRWKAKWSVRAPHFVYHSIMLAHVECAMTHASKKQDARILREWISEVLGTFKYTNSRKKSKKEGAGIIRPDGVAVIGNKRNVSANGILFLEMERSFSTKEVLIEKITRYNEFMRQHKMDEYVKHAGISYPVGQCSLTFIAGSKNREKELMRYLKGVDSPEIPVFITLYEDILQNPFGEIFRDIEEMDEKVGL
ncbi:replication-relaxation family protein [Bacillus mycoides]|uniref:replication-relaxation family protein n=1 Tax=Bacillus mycoides TaxID=1405 RepID=UPI002112A06D|nr:replication-relaxation family protein [Bacillus mycoides]MCQ6530272.1 replication-relaxation family protein [Bacillus mycoides]